MGLVPSRPSDVFSLCVHVRIFFDHSAHVSDVSLGLSDTQADSLSYALWERKKIVLVITCAILFADTVALVYGRCLSLLSPRSPDACDQSQQFLVRTGMEPFVILTI